jgi:hypothetical protein
MKRFLTTITLLTLTLGLQAQTVYVYEGFQYGDAADLTRAGNASLQGQADGSGGDIDATGLGGTWDDVLNSSSGELYMANGSLSFGDLTTSGNHVRSDTNQNNDIFSRPITASLDGGSELWFSFLGNKLQNNFDAAEEGIFIGTQDLTTAQIQSQGNTVGLSGFAIAPTTAGNNWSAYAWDGASQFDVGGTYSVPTNGSETNLLLGQISFGTGAGGTDEFSAFYYDLAASGGTVTTTGSLVQIGSTIEVDVEEGTLDTLNVTRQVNTAFDEIRIGDSLDAVLGIPEPSSLTLFGLGGLALYFLRRRPPAH